MRFLLKSIVIFQMLAIVLVGTFLLAAIFSMTFGMQISEHNGMVGCPFMSGQSSICLMGVFEHIAKWQRLFTAIVPKSSGVIFTIFLSLFLAFLNFWASAAKRLLVALAPSSSILQDKPETRLFDCSTIAFSRGILHPKIY